MVQNRSMIIERSEYVRIDRGYYGLTAFTPHASSEDESCVHLFCHDGGSGSGSLLMLTSTEARAMAEQLIAMAELADAAEPSPELYGKEIQQ